MISKKALAAITGGHYTSRPFRALMSVTLIALAAPVKTGGFDDG